MDQKRQGKDASVLLVEELQGRDRKEQNLFFPQVF